MSVRFNKQNKIEKRKETSRKLQETTYRIKRKKEKKLWVCIFLKNKNMANVLSARLVEVDDVNLNENL